MARELKVQTHDLPENQMLGLRTNWIMGSDDYGMEFSLDSTAGLGGSDMALSIFQDGKCIAVEIVDMRPVVTEWVKQILAERKNDEPTPAAEA